MCYTWRKTEQTVESFDSEQKYIQSFFFSLQYAETPTVLSRGEGWASALAFIFLRDLWFVCYRMFAYSESEREKRTASSDEVQKWKCCCV